MSNYQEKFKTIDEHKNHLRQHLIKKREQLPHRELLANSRAITERLRELEPLAVLLEQLPEEPIGLYAAFRGEPDVRPLVPHLVAAGIKIAFPAIVHCPETGENCMRFGLYEPHQPLRLFLNTGHFGISEPPPESLLPTGTPMSALIMPGVAFDHSGTRIGFGKGYYDSFIASLPHRPMLIGVAHPFQLLNDPLPKAGHDQPLDYIVLPNETIVVKCNH